MLLSRPWTWRPQSHCSIPYDLTRILFNLTPTRDFASAMSSNAVGENEVSFNKERLDEFHAYLKQSKRVLALCGAGLSASSGLPTFRGPGGLWRTHNSVSLATPGAFEENPGLVWQ